MQKSKSIIQTDPAKNITVFDRTTCDILKITEDKLRLKLKDFEISVESRAHIFFYAGLSLTLLTTLLTANFKEWILKAELWQAIFIVALLVSSIFAFLSYRKHAIHKKDIDSVISDIKKGG